MEDDGLLTSFSQRHKVLAVALATVFVGSGSARAKAMVDVDENEPLTTFSQAYKEYTSSIASGKYAADQLASVAKQTYQLGKAKFGPRHANTFMLQQNLANAYLEAGEYALSATHYVCVIDYYEETQGEESQAYYFALLDIINLLHTAYKAQKLSAQDLSVPQYARDKAIIKLLRVTEALVSAMPENSILFRAHSVKTALMNPWTDSNGQLLKMAKQLSVSAKKAFKEDSRIYVESVLYLGQIYFAMHKSKDALLAFDYVLANVNMTQCTLDSKAALIERVSHAHLVSLYARKNQFDKANFHSQASGRRMPWMGEKAVLHKVVPKFPALDSTSADAQQASVVVHFDINENGRPINMRAEESRDARCNKFAMAAIKQWYFVPKFVNGKFEIANGYNVTIDFLTQ